MFRCTQDTHRLNLAFVYGALTLCRTPSQMFRLTQFIPRLSPTTPMCMHIGLGSSHFARRYYGNRVCFLFLQVLRCFSSLRLPHLRVTTCGCRVPPFGYLWILAYLQLPKAFRCSSRPSSAPSAKAFTVRPYLLNHYDGRATCFHLSMNSVNSRFDYISFLRNYIFTFEIVSYYLLASKK